MAKTLVCPYCYETFTARQILFRCNTRVSRTLQRCSTQRDPVLEERYGIRGEVGPVFTADGRNPTAVCVECKSETTYRVCPVCRRMLPVQFGMMDSRLIAMVGAKASGKTVLMTVLLHELMNRVGENFQISLMGADDETMVRFGSGYHDNLYTSRQLPKGTDAAGARDTPVDPLVFRFGLMRDRLLGSSPLHAVLSFFDTAGEDFNTRESVEVNTRYLSNAAGIILVLDPLQMQGARDLALPGTLLPSLVNVDSPINVLGRVTQMLLARAPGRTVDTPIAVVFSKMDALWHLLDEGSPLRGHPQPRSRFDVSDSLSVHEEVRHQLRAWEGSAIDQNLRTHYKRYRYFGVSALGRTPTPDSRVAPTGIQPYRIADPLLWLLSEFGALPRQGRG